MAEFSFARLAALSTMFTLVAGTPLAVAAETSAPTFDEIMRQGVAFDEARISPDGRHALFGTSSSRTMSHGMMLNPLQGVYVTDLAGGTARALTSDGDADSYMEACATWAPDSRGVVVLRRRGVDPVLAYLDIATREVVEFAPPVRTFCNSWVGDKLVYTTSEANPPSPWSEAGALENMGRRWRAGWEGDTPQVTSHSANPDFPSPAPTEGGIAVADPRTGGAVLVARGEFNVALTPSPDGRRFAAIRLAEATPDALDRMSGRRGEVQVYELTTGGARLVQAIADFDVGKASIAWSADGKHLLAGGRRIGRPEASLLVLDPARGSRRALSAPPGADILADDTTSALNLWPIGWVAGSPAVLARTSQAAAPASDQHMEYGPAHPGALRLYSYRPDGRADDLTSFARQSIDRFASGPDDDALVAADGALWSLAPGRAPRRVSPPGLDVIGMAEARSSYGDRKVTAVGDGRIAVRVRDAAEDRFVVLNVKTGDPVWSLPAGPEAFFAPNMSASVRVTHQGWSSRLVAEGAITRTLAETNPEWRDRPAGEVKRYTYQLGDRQLNGWIVLPPHYVSGRLPAVVWIYGGQVLGGAPPRAALPGGGVTPLYDGQLWAREGYAVIYPSTPIGRGSDANIPDLLAAATVAAVDAAAARGWVDPSRVGIMGQSFGGYSTASVLASRSDRFRAGVAISGVYDFEAAWGARMPLESMVDADSYPFVLETRAYVETGQGGLAAPPWAAPEAYRRNSPFYRVSSIRSPLLLFNGDLDLGVTSLHLAERFYAALRRTGNAAVLVRYWGQGHVQRDPWAVRDEWTRARAWFGKYLQQGAPTPEKP